MIKYTKWDNYIYNVSRLENSTNTKHAEHLKMYVQKALNNLVINNNVFMYSVNDI